MREAYCDHEGATTRTATGRATERGRGLQRGAQRKKIVDHVHGRCRRSHCLHIASVTMTATGDREREGEVWAATSSRMAGSLLAEYLGATLRRPVVAGPPDQPRPSA